MGVLRPLVKLMSTRAEPKQYAGLALLKLADNFENHVAIAKEGGIQALLRLGRTRTTDDELQYKAALTVGSLASNAVKMLPHGVPGGAATAGASGGAGGGKIGTGAGMGQRAGGAAAGEDQPPGKPAKGKKKREGGKGAAAAAGAF